MSFRQDRTNPSQAVSNFKGRTDTPKAWPSTAVGNWTNGGLFGSSKMGMEAIQTYTADQTVSTISFQSIPQTYRNLRVVVRSAQTAAYGVGFFIYLNNTTYAPIYDTIYIGNGNAANYIEAGGATSSKTPAPIGYTIGGYPNYAGYWIWDIPNYSTAGKNRVSLARIGNKGVQNSGGYTSLFQQHYASSTAVSAIVVTLPAVGAAPSNYYFKVPMTVTLYGIGTAP